MTLLWLSKKTPLDYNGTVNMFIDQSDVIAERCSIAAKKHMTNRSGNTQISESGEGEKACLQTVNWFDKASEMPELGEANEMSNRMFTSITVSPDRSAKDFHSNLPKSLYCMHRNMILTNRNTRSLALAHNWLSEWDFFEEVAAN